jgi:hypothetical protein
MGTLDHVAAVLAKAEAGGARAAELAALCRRLRQLGEPQAGRLPGEVLEPLADLPRLDELPEPPPGQARDVLGRLAVVKLDGGLGTSMARVSRPRTDLRRTAPLADSNRAVEGHRHHQDDLPHRGFPRRGPGGSAAQAQPLAR